jgi:DNA-binding XRE family transcriptional regulator
MSDQGFAPRPRPGRASLVLVEAKDFSQRADFVIWGDVTNLPQIATVCDSPGGTVPRRGTWKRGGGLETSTAVSTVQQRNPVAINIRAAREAARLTQEELAALVGVRRTRVNDWENGRHQPSRQHLAELCAALGHTRGWFYDPHPRNEAQP